MSAMAICSYIGYSARKGQSQIKKRTYRIYTEEGLQARTKKRKKLIRSRIPMIVPIAQNVRWLMDFVSDQLSSSRRLCVLNVIDDYLSRDGWPVNLNID